MVNNLNKKTQRERERETERQRSVTDGMNDTNSVAWLIRSLRLSGPVVSAFGIRARGPGFDSRVAPLFH